MFPWMLNQNMNDLNIDVDEMEEESGNFDDL